MGIPVCMSLAGKRGDTGARAGAFGGGCTVLCQCRTLSRADPCRSQAFLFPYCPSIAVVDPDTGKASDEREFHTTGSAPSSSKASGSKSGSSGSGSGSSTTGSTGTTGSGEDGRCRDGPVSRQAGLPPFPVRLGCLHTARQIRGQRSRPRTWAGPYSLESAPDSLQPQVRRAPCWMSLTAPTPAPRQTASRLPRSLRASQIRRSSLEGAHEAAEWSSGDQRWSSCCLPSVMAACWLHMPCHA